MEETKSFCQVEDFHFIPGKKNPADIATREDGKLKDIGIGSEWQSPSFLKEKRENWPITRDFGKYDPPQEELRKRNVVSFLALKIKPNEAKLWEIVENVCNSRNDLNKVLRMLVRILRGVEMDFSKIGNCINLPHVINYQKSKESITKDMSEERKSSINDAKSLFSSCPHKNDLISVIEDLSAPISQVEMDRAEHLVMLYAMQLTRQELEENKLTSLLPFEENGIIYT